MKKISHVLHFKVLIEQDADGLYIGSVPELPSCYTQAKSIEELRKRLKEVIQLVLESDSDARIAKIKSPFPSPRFFGIEDLNIQYA